MAGYKTCRYSIQGIVIAVFLIKSSCSDTFNSDWFVSQKYTTWKEGFNVCRNKTNFTMASADEILENKLLKDVNKQHTGPYWTFGFFGIGDANITPVTNKVVIQSKEVSGNAYTYCSHPPEFFKIKMPFAETEKSCSERNNSLLYAKVSNLFSTMKVFSDKFLIDLPFWLQNREDSLSSDVASNTEIKCILLEDDGTIKIDNCQRHHKVICMQGTQKPTIVYKENTFTIPSYTASTAATTALHTAHYTSTTPLLPVFTTRETGTQDAGVIAGSVAGSGVLIVVISLIVYYLVHRRMSKVKSSSPSQDMHYQNINAPSLSTNTPTTPPDDLYIDLNSETRADTSTYGVISVSGQDHPQNQETGMDDDGDYPHPVNREDTNIYLNL